MIGTSELTRVPFTTLAEINPTRATSSLAPDAEVSFIPMGDVTESGQWIGRQSRQYSEVRHGFTCFAEGDVLFAKITPCMENGKGCLAAGLLNSIGFGSTEFHVLRARSEADAGFIYQWSIHQDLRHQAKNSMTGSAGQQRVPTDFFRQFLVPALPKPEQTKIAEILSTVDRSIEQTEALIAKQQRIKTGLMQDLLTRGIDERGNLRSEQTHPFRDSPLGRIPMEWDDQPLTAVIHGSAQNGFFKKPELVGSGYKLINVSEIYQPFGIDTDLEKVERVAALPEDLNRYGVAEGDLFFTRSSLVLEGIAHCNIIRKVQEPTLFECHVMRIRPRKDKIVPEFLALYCKSHAARLFLMSRAKYVTMTTISQPELEALYVPVPPRLDEQLAIVDIALSSDSAMRQTQARRAKLMRLKTGLMQDLLTGKKRVTPLLDPELTN